MLLTIPANFSNSNQKFIGNFFQAPSRYSTDVLRIPHPPIHTNKNIAVLKLQL